MENKEKTRNKMKIIQKIKRKVNDNGNESKE